MEEENEYHCYVCYDAPLRNLFNPLVPELSGQCTVRETRVLNGHFLLNMFLADDFR